MIICDYKKCTACMACANVCPKDAISAGFDDTYKTVPVIDEDKCIKCNKCKNICPQNSDSVANEAKKCYAAGARVGADVTNCASAGVSAAFCEYVTENNGVVFGAGYKNGKVAYVCAKTVDEAETLKGSKYVECETGDIYKEVKEYLDRGTFVLFTGTPCKVAGLYAVLGKDYENLLTVDLICHGTPPVKFLDDYLDEKNVSKNRTKITFRGTDDYKLKVYENDELIFCSDATFDEYYRAFYNNITLRNNCFSCRYTTEKNRPADISIGDFWGLDKSTLKTPISGKASVILTNTEKGEEFLIKTGLPCEERKISEAVSGNAQLKRPALPNKDIDKFLRNYSEGFIKAVNKTCVRKNIRDNKRNSRIDKVKQRIRKVLGI